MLTLYRKDIKATALLKLMYLEMFGYDMSWAAFHVLEVMSSPKYLQKRIGYLGAVQSFRPDTEVLMLATNLLKKVCSHGQFAAKSAADRVAGLNGDCGDHNVSSHNNTTAYYNIIPRNVSAIRSTPEAHALKSCGSEEDHCYIIPAGTCISRDTETFQCQNQGTVDG